MMVLVLMLIYLSTYCSEKHPGDIGLFQNIALMRDLKSSSLNALKSDSHTQQKKRLLKASNSGKKGKFGGLILILKRQPLLLKELNIWKEMKLCKNCLKQFEYLTYDGFCETCVQILSNRQLAFEQKKRVEELELQIAQYDYNSDSYDSIINILELRIKKMESAMKEFVDQVSMKYGGDDFIILHANKFKQLLEKEIDE